MKSYFIATIIFLLLLVAGGCTSEPDSDEIIPPQTLATTEEPTQEEGFPDTTGPDVSSPVVSEPPTSQVVTEPEELRSGYIVDKELCFENSQVEVYHITYMSDGLKVKGYLAQPKAFGIYPAIIYNRGGNLEFGKLSSSTLTVFASNGFVAIGSQYRGNDGGEGREEFGGEDINDVLSLIPLLKSLTNVDASKIGMVGYSRGGMMTYLALKEQTLRGTDDIKAACTVGGLADLFMNAEERADMVTSVFIPLIGGAPDQRPQEYEARSATYWADKIDTPLLIQHGEADWRVSVEEARALVRELEKYGKEYELVTYPGDDHGLSGHNNGLYGIFTWLAEHLEVSINLQNIAEETPYSAEDIEPGEIDGGYFCYEAKGYKIIVPSQGWSVKIPSPPLDVMFAKLGGSWIGVGAFSEAIYTASYFEGINELWVSDITTKWGYIDVQVIEKGDLIIADHSAKYVTFEYTSDAKRYRETTYHIWQPASEFRLYKIRVNCPKDSYDELQDTFEELVNSFTFLP